MNFSMLHLRNILHSLGMNTLYCAGRLFRGGNGAVCLSSHLDMSSFAINDTDLCCDLLITTSCLLLLFIELVTDIVLRFWSYVFFWLVT